MDELPVAAVRAALARTPAVVLVSGAAGMGKTWLAARVLATAPYDVRVVVDCRGLPDEPHVVVRELVRGLVEAGGPAAQAEVVIAAAEAASGESDYRTCAALRDLLAATAERAGSPVLVVVDDVDLADRWSRHVLRCCASRPPDQAALLLTYSPGQKRALWTQWRSAAQGGVLRVELGPLSAAEVAALADAPREWTDEVHRLTGGVPLFVAEVLAHVPPDQGDPGQTLLRIGLPEAIADLVADRLRALPASTQRLVAAASLLRGPFTADIPAEVCRMTKVKAESLLLRAADAGMPALRDDGAFEFRPPLIGVAVAWTMSATDRRRGHAAVARALERRGGEALVELIHHCRAAGDVVAAARHAERAAERAVRSGEPEAAVDLLRDLLGEPTLPRRERASLAGRLGRLALGSLAYGETMALLRDIVADDLLPDGVRGELRLHLGLLLGNQAGDGDAQRTQFRIAIRELRRRPLLAARAMSSLALPYWGSCHIDEHLSWLAEAERIAPARGDPALLMAVRVNRASTLLQIGDQRAWEVIAALPDEGATAGEHQELIRGYINFTDAATSLGHNAAAADFHARAEDLASRAGPAYLRHMSAGHRLRLALATGQWAGIDQVARAHLITTEQTPYAAADASLVLGNLALARGEWTEAEQFLRAAGLQQASGWRAPGVVSGAATRIRLALARDRPAEALAELARAVEMVRVKAVWAWATELADAGVEALLHVGDIPQAERLLDEFTADVATRDCPFGHAMIPRCQGAIAAAHGWFTEAEALFAEAVTLLAALPRPYDQARAIEAAARCRLAAGQPAIEQVTEASRLFTVLGATWDAARCDHLAREHGGAPGFRPGRRGYGAELSPREREVARLMALGRTNRQIAEVLFLSPRTVERHAARVLRKLGVTDRDHVRLADL